jgi:hypothetical protein
VAHNAFGFELDEAVRISEWILPHLTTSDRIARIPLICNNDTLDWLEATEIIQDTAFIVTVLSY